MKLIPHRLTRTKKSHRWFALHRIWAVVRHLVRHEHAPLQQSQRFANLVRTLQPNCMVSGGSYNACLLRLESRKIYEELT